MQFPSWFVEQLFAAGFRIRVLYSGMFLNKKHMKPLEKSANSCF